jgi:hypothetical protein
MTVSKKGKGETENSQKFIILTEPDYTQPYEELYEQTFQDCRDDYETHRAGIECEISNVKRRITELRSEQEMIRTAILQGAAYRPGCVDTSVYEEDIEHLQGYVHFLSAKRDRLKKHTRELFAKEKYAYLEMLGLFQTEVWKELLRNAATEQRERLISEIIGCDIDSARHLMNGRDSMKAEKRKELQTHINQMSKGV